MSIISYLDKFEPNYIDNHIKFYSILEDTLPEFVPASDIKKISPKFKMRREYALRDKKFLYFNKSAVYSLIFDIDYKITMNALHERIKQKIGVEPTYICRTTKGLQVGFILQNYITYNNKKAIKLTRKIKKAVTYILGADPAGSNRLRGVWRNPLTHQYKFYGNLCQLRDFYKLLSTPQQKFTADIKLRQISNNSFAYVEGNRNTYLFYLGMLATKGKDWGKDIDSVFSYLNKLQEEQSQKNNTASLEVKELIGIAKSVSKYNEAGTNFVKTAKRNIREGIMGFPKIQNLTQAEYKEEVKKRQKLSAKRTNKLKEQKMSKQKKQELAKQLAKQKEYKTYKKVINLITGLFADEYKKKSGAWHYKKIAEHLNLDYRTVSKHIKKFTQEQSTKKEKE